MPRKILTDQPRFSPPPKNGLLFYTKNTPDEISGMSSPGAMIYVTGPGQGGDDVRTYLFKASKELKVFFTSTNSVATGER